MTSSPVSRVVYNGKRPASNTRSPSSNEIFTPAHEENVRFIYEAWQCVERDLRNQVSGMDRGVVEEYVEKNPSNSLKSTQVRQQSFPPPVLVEGQPEFIVQELLDSRIVRAFKPIDLNDLKRRTVQDPNKS